jgi:hypothetical protein
VRLHFIGWSKVSSLEPLLSIFLNLRDIIRPYISTLGHNQALHLHYLELEIIRNVDQSTHMCGFVVDIATCPLRNRLVIDQLLIVWQHTVCVKVQNTRIYYNLSKCWLHWKFIAILKMLCFIKQFCSGNDMTF